MFSKKSEAVEGRYLVQAFVSGRGLAKPDVYAEGLQDMLNEGEAKGWRLVWMGSPGSSGATMLTWDTQPQ